MQNHECCVISRGTTTNYFKPERGNRQGHPNSAYLFILVLEIAFLFIIQNKNINGLNVFENTFLYTAYADDTTFFLRDEKSVIELMKTVDIFSIFSGLKPNKSKCEVAGLGALKGVKIALCGMECTDLMFNQSIFWNSITHLNKNFENQENFINLVLKIKKLKSLAISKTVLLALVKVIPNSVILELDKIKKNFIWKNSNPKIEQDNHCKDYGNSGLKNVNITFKRISLQCSCIKQLYDNSIHDWKLIRLHIMTQKLGKHGILENFLNIIKKY